MAGVSTLAIKIVAEAASAISELGKTGDAVGDLDGKSKGLLGSLSGAAGGIALVGGAAIGAAVVVGELTKAAAEDRAEQEKLIAVYDSVGISLEEATAATEAAIDAGAAKAFSDSEVRAGLQSLIVATGDAAKANELLGPAMDIARLAGVDLETASKALAKAHDGNDASLRKLIPGLEKGKTSLDTIAAATELASGQADLYATSAEGMQKKAGDAFGEIGEQVGQVFLPIMDELLPALLPFVELLGELITAVLPLLKPAIQIVVGALKVFIDVLKTVIGFVQDVIKAVQDAIKWIQDMVNLAANAVDSVAQAIDDINPFSAGPPVVAAPTFGRRFAAQALGLGVQPRQGTLPGLAGNTIVNVDVRSADPQEVMRAIRRWSRANGGAGPFDRGLKRATG